MAGWNIPQEDAFLVEGSPKMIGQIEKLLERLKAEVKEQFPSAWCIQAWHKDIMDIFIVRFLTKTIGSIDYKWMQKIAKKYGLEYPNFDVYPYDKRNVEVYMSWRKGGD
jgi:hypothetical protein